MFNTVLPNCLAPLIVQATLGFATAILDAAALGFLGLGAQPPTPEWGTMLAGALQFYQRAWWVLAFPGPRDPAHRAGVQPVRRRAARRARSEAEALMALLEIRNLAVEFATARGVFRAVDGARPHAGQRRDRRHRRRIRLRQERRDAGGDGADRLARPRHAPTGCTSPASTCCTCRRASAAALIGKDMAMVFQEPTTSLNPCYPDRLADRREPARAPRGGAQRGARPGDRPAATRSAFRHPRRGSARFRISFPAA